MYIGTGVSSHIENDVDVLVRPNSCIKEKYFSHLTELFNSTVMFVFIRQSHWNLGDGPTSLIVELYSFSHSFYVSAKQSPRTDNKMPFTYILLGQLFKTILTYHLNVNNLSNWYRIIKYHTHQHTIHPFWNSWKQKTAELWSQFVLFLYIAKPTLLLLIILTRKHEDKESLHALFPSSHFKQLQKNQNKSENPL